MNSGIFNERRQLIGLLADDGEVTNLDGALKGFVLADGTVTASTLRAGRRGR